MHGLLEPTPGCGVLHVPHALFLNGRDVARLMLCTCTELRARMQHHGALEAFLHQVRLGGLTALETLKLHSESDDLFVPCRVLNWLHDFSKYDIYDDFSGQSLLGGHDVAPAAPGKLQWYLFGKLDPSDKRSIETANADGLAQCVSLRIGRHYPDTPLHFGRGVVARFPCSMQLSCFSMMMRISLTDGRQPMESSVGYFILSDGRPDGPTSQGRFGTEAMFVFARVDVNHEATLYAAGPYQTHILCTVSIAKWIHFCVEFNWECHRAEIMVREASGRTLIRNGSSVAVPFRGRCESLRQVSLLAVEDLGGVTVSWTSLWCSSRPAAFCPSLYKQSHADLDTNIKSQGPSRCTQT